MFDSRADIDLNAQFRSLIPVRWPASRANELSLRYRSHSHPKIIELIKP